MREQTHPQTHPQARSQARDQAVSQAQTRPPKRSHAVVAMCVALVCIVIGLVHLGNTIGMYVSTRSQLNSLQSQQVSLQTQKKSLDDQIRRWNDESYVKEQARLRFGFVMPGETLVTVTGIPNSLK